MENLKIQIQIIVTQIFKVKEVDRMYPNLRAEMARYNITNSDLAATLGVTVGTMSLKLNKKGRLTLTEAKKIKKRVRTELPLDVLFEEEE